MRLNRLTIPQEWSSECLSVKSAAKSLPPAHEQPKWCLSHGPKTIRHEVAAMVFGDGFADLVQAAAIMTKAVPATRLSVKYWHAKLVRKQSLHPSPHRFSSQSWSRYPTRTLLGNPSLNNPQQGAEENRNIRHSSEVHSGELMGMIGSWQLQVAPHFLVRGSGDGGRYN